MSVGRDHLSQARERPTSPRMARLPLLTSAAEAFTVPRRPERRRIVRPDTDAPAAHNDPDLVRARASAAGDQLTIWPVGLHTHASTLLQAESVDATVSPHMNLVAEASLHHQLPTGLIDDRKAGPGSVPEASGEHGSYERHQGTHQRPLSIQTHASRLTAW